MHKHAVYIASPFFNEEQLANVKKVESFLSSNNISYYSPRSSGINFQNCSAEEREILSSKVFKENVDNINDALFVLACIDDRDTGTSWEIGYAFSAGKTIVTFSGKGYGVNVMLAKSTSLHLDNLGKVGIFLKGFGFSDKNKDQSWLDESIETFKGLVGTQLETNE